MPKVSIIMPLYNSEQFIEETIKSIINQSYSDWELIIVDDYSNDNSVRIIEKYMNNGNEKNKIKIIKNTKNFGPAYSRNEAIKEANGRYIAFIDSDDIWKKEKLEKQINFMEENKVGFVFSSYNRIKENGKLEGTVKAPEIIDFNYILKRTPIQISSVIVDTKIVDKKIIKFKDIKTSEDISLYLNILSSEIMAYGMKESLVDYRNRRKSRSSNKIMNTIRRWNLYKEYNVSLLSRLKNIIRHILDAIFRLNPVKKQLKMEKNEKT